MMRDKIVSRYDYGDINIHASIAFPRLSKWLSWLLDTMLIRNVLTDPDNHTITGPGMGYRGHPPLSAPRKGSGSLWDRNSQEHGEGRGVAGSHALQPARMGD